MRSSSRAASRVPYVFLAPTIVLLLAIGIYPLLYSLYYSTFYFSLFYPERAHFIGLENFIDLFKNQVFRTSLLVTAKFTAVVVPVELLLGLGLALLFKDEARGETVLRTMMMIPMMLAPIAVGYLWKHMLWPGAGLIDTILSYFGIQSPGWFSSYALALPSLMIIDIWQWTPFTFLILLSGLRALPNTLFEAAKIDGADAWNAFRHLTLPLMKRMILVVILFRLIDSIRLFDQPYIVTYGGPGFETYTASIFLYIRGLKETFDIGQAAAGSWILNFVIMLLALPLLRLLAKGKER